MPATIGISAASATSFSIEPSNTPITRDATNAVTRLIASHAQRLLERLPHRREDVLLLAQAGLREHFLLAALAHEVEDLVDGDATDEPVVGVDDRRADTRS